MTNQDQLKLLDALMDTRAMKEDGLYVEPCLTWRELDFMIDLLRGWVNGEDVK